MSSKQVSSFFLDDQSQLSILAHPKKTQFQQTNQILMKQISELRSENRTLKHQNKWILNDKQGLDQQCNTLKQLYQTSKQTISTLNSDLRCANQQINRLQDLLNQKQYQLDSHIEQTRQINSQNQRSKNQIKQLKNSISDKNMKIQFLQKQLQFQKQHKMNESVKQMTIFNDKLIQIVNRLDHSPSKSHRSARSQRQDSNQKQSPYRLIQKLESLLSQQKQNHEYYREQSYKLTQKIAIIERKYQISETQLKQASMLLEESRQQHRNITQNMQKINEQHKNTVKNHQKDLENINKNYKLAINRIIQIVQIFVPDQVSLCYKLVQIMPLSSSNNNKINQLQLVIGQLKAIVYTQNAKIGNIENKIDTNKKLQRKLNNITQQLELLRIKHKTLQRQHDAIIQDNRRILKYNTLSKYRTQRNLKDSNKQNRQSNFNLNSISKTKVKQY